MAVKKLSELTALTTAADGDLMLINDISEASDADKPKRITAANLKSYMAADVIAAVGLLNGLGISPQLRLSATSGNPADSSDSGMVGTIYYTPYVGDGIQLYDGSAWKAFALAELSLALTLVDMQNYDVFVDYNAGTPRLVLSAAWSSNTVRADALAYLDGRLVKSGTPAYLYVGTIKAFGTNTTIDSSVSRYIYNHYNRIPRPCQVTGVTHSASVFIKFVVGDPNGMDVNCGLGGFYTVNGQQTAFSYLYSSLIPSAAPGHGQAGIRNYIADGTKYAVGSAIAAVIHFPLGYNYLEMKPAVAGGGIYSAGVLYANLWM